MSNIEKMKDICANIRNIVEGNNNDRFIVANEIVSNLMAKYPDSATPHNLMGIIKEMQGDHVLAMKHFRAAYALDPQDKAVKHNFDTLCSFKSSNRLFQYGDCDLEVRKQYVVEYDDRGIGHIVRKKA